MSETREEQEQGGLTTAEAARRLSQYGHNELATKERSALLVFLGYFWAPIPWMIEAALVLSAAVRDWTDFGIIAALLVANALVGFWEEHQAGNAIAALRQKLALRARALRDGKWQVLAARDLVPGDRIRLRLGDIVPADARLGEGDPIEVDQSALTGESLPVERQPGAEIYSGSIVSQGEIEASVTKTGGATFFGRTAQLVQEAQKTSHFQRAVLKIGDYLIAIAVVLVVLILATALFRGDALMAALQFALVLTVASIPVAMPTVLSVTMAVGARLLARKEAVVSRLAAIEELAGLDVLCSDKTGTLTQNRLTLGEPFAAKGVTPADVVLAGALASSAGNKDPIDEAVLAAVADPAILARHQVTHFVPFDPVHKRTEAAVTGPDGKPFRVSKGAPQVILGLLGGDREAAAGKAVEDFASRGFRSLGVARLDGDGPWRLLGILPLHDPPRADSKATIDAARGLGIRVKMVTGDQVAIGREIARELDLGTNILDASTLAAKGGLADVVEHADGFAQVFPEHKYRIVQALQGRGHIVGMTGDGVNDAPALKQADAGIAVSGATDAARAAADIVLMTPGLSVIIDAIRESRRIFQRMTSYATYRIAETIRVLLLMTLSILVFDFYPVTAVMIVLLALLNDGAILSIAYDRVTPSPQPERWNMRLVLGVASVLGFAGVVASFGLFYLGDRVFRLDRETIRTLLYLKLSVAGHLTVFVTRTRGPFWSVRPARVLLLAVLGTQALATLIAVYGVFMKPVGWHWALMTWGYALAWFLVNDRAKLAAYALFGEPEPALPGARRYR